MLSLKYVKSCWIILKLNSPTRFNGSQVGMLSCPKTKDYFFFYAQGTLCTHMHTSALNRQSPSIILVTVEALE